MKQKNNSELKRRIIILPNEQILKLDAAAEKAYTSRSGLIRNILAKFLEGT